MNNKLLSLVLMLACAGLFAAQAQEPPGCNTKVSQTRKQLKTSSAQRSEIKGHLPKRKVLDLRSHKTRKPVEPQENTTRAIPVIATPFYLPQTNGASAAITASNGYLYVVVGQKLYKVSEKTLKTVQVSQLGTRDVPTIDSDPPKRKKKIVASKDEEPVSRKVTAKRRGSKTD